jgi:hypothetical protein
MTVTLQDPQARLKDLFTTIDINSPAAVGDTSQGFFRWSLENYDELDPEAKATSRFFPCAPG